MLNRLQAAAIDAHKQVKTELDQLDKETKHYEMIAQSLATNKYESSILSKQSQSYVNDSTSAKQSIHRPSPIVFCEAIFLTQKY